VFIMYAVISSGGKQYKVSEGQTIRLEKLPGEVGTEIDLTDVLLLVKEGDVRIGKPLLPEVVVKCHIIGQRKAKKIIVFKYKKRKRYRRKLGHRQPFTELKIDSIAC